MALITRFTRLFQADIHAVLDRVEEPDVLLRHAIREMEEDIVRDEQKIRELEYENGQIRARQSDLQQALNDMNEELDICFESGKEDLARAVLRRKLQAEQMDRTLTRKHTSVAKSLSGFNGRVNENRERLSVMQQKSELLSERSDAAQSGPPWTPQPSVISDEDVEVAFLREQQQRSRP